MKITLMTAPCSSEALLADAWYLPLGLISIAHAISRHEADITIIDGAVSSLTDCLAQTHGHIVGIGFNCFSTEEMAILAKAAKENGAFTIVGGQAASTSAEVILRENNYVDAVVIGDGEVAMGDLVRVLNDGRDLGCVRNMVYRRDTAHGTILTHNDSVQMDLASQPLLRRDVGGINPHSYMQRYNETNSDGPSDSVRATNVVTRRGCPRRAAGVGCSFCARIDKTVRCRTPQQAWEEYSYLSTELGANYLYEDSDSWINTKWLAELAGIWEREGGLDVRFRVYGDIRDINPRSVALLKRLRVDTVLLGIESGDRNVLMQNGKDFSSIDVERSCRLLADAEIRIADAYVLGLAGETWNSIDRTLELAESVHRICEVNATYWNIMLPLPGAPAWNMLLSSSPRANEFSGTYRHDMRAVREEFLKYCTNLGAGALERLDSLRAELCEQSSMLVGEYIR